MLHGGNSGGILSAGGFQIAAQGADNSVAGSGKIVFFTTPTNSANSSTDANYVERMRITHDGNVGIGTTGPTGRLGIITNTSGTDFALSIGTTAAANNVVVLTNGNVGIGTTDPTHKLSISSTGTSQFKAVNTTASGSGGGAGLQGYSDDGAAMANGDRLGFLTFGGSEDAVSTLNNSVAITGWAEEDWTSSANGAFLSFETQPLGTSGFAARTEKMRITASGNVGIGTTGPSALLHLYKTQNTSTGFVVHNDNAGTAAKSSFVIGNSPTASPWDGLFSEHYGTGFTTAGLRKPSSAAVFSGAGATNGLSIGTGANAPLSFFTNGIGNGADMTLDINGNLGIGLTTPIARLDITTKTSGTDYALNIGTTATASNVVVLTNGNVGIGTTNPATKFAVAGLTSTSGTAVVVDASGNFYTSSSSKRFKTNIKDYKVDFSRILQVMPKSFNYKATGVADIGYIAEDLEKLGLKDLLIYDKDGLLQTVKYDRISLYLVEVVKSQVELIKSQELKLNNLEARVAKLEAMSK
jgi:hypothetical protein